MQTIDLFDISISICTYRRPTLLQICLKHLIRQKTSRSFDIVIIDNDFQKSGEEVVNSLREEAKNHNLFLKYFVEPEQNISLARNRAVANSEGFYVAFIDDDEFAPENWLERLGKELEASEADGVFGPVVSVFPQNFPLWMQQSKLFERKRWATGHRLSGTGYATGNALIKKSILTKRLGPFDPAYGLMGGEDSELFTWLNLRGARFVWCNEAIVYEVQEERRVSLRFYLKRGYRGGWLYSDLSYTRKGWLWGMVDIFSRVILGSMKIIVEAISQINNPRGAVFYLLRGMAGQAGKMGYFIGLRLEEYRK